MTNPDHMQRARELLAAEYSSSHMANDIATAELIRDGFESRSYNVKHYSCALRAIAAALSEAQGPVRDARLLDWLHSESWQLGPFDIPTGAGDADVGWRVIEHRVDAPHERVIAEVYVDDPRAALELAATALSEAQGRETPEWLDDVKRCLSDISQEHGHVGRGNRRFEALLSRINATRWQVEPAASVGREAVMEVVLDEKGRKNLRTFVDGGLAEALLGHPVGTRFYTHPAAVVDDAMVERGVRAAESVSDARLPRHKVVRAILTAAFSAPNGGEG